MNSFDIVLPYLENECVHSLEYYFLYMLISFKKNDKQHKVVSFMEWLSWTCTVQVLTVYLQNGAMVRNIVQLYLIMKTHLPEHLLEVVL